MRMGLVDGLATAPRARGWAIFVSVGCSVRLTNAVRHAALAQSVEHFTRNEKVKSSILLGGSENESPSPGQSGEGHFRARTRREERSAETKEATDSSGGRT